MEPGQIMPIVVTVVAIVSAAVAALLCDMLRTENARLRQANLALLAQRQKRQRRTEQTSPQAVEVPPPRAPEDSARGLPLIEARASTSRETAPLPVGIAAYCRPVRLVHGQDEGTRSAGEFGGRGKTLGEARELARDWLSAAQNGRSKAVTPMAAADPTGGREFQKGSTNGSLSGAAPRRDWGVLLNPQADRPESEAGAFEPLHTCPVDFSQPAMDN